MTAVMLYAGSAGASTNLTTTPTASAALNAADTSGWSWDIGLGLAAIAFPAYRGAQDFQTLALPVPTFSFSSPRVSLGRQGARWSLLEYGPMRVRISASGSLPVNSDDVAIRADMPDLYSSFEAGPALIIDLHETATWSTNAEVLLRNVIATDFKNWQPIGWTVQPRINTQANWTFDNATRLNVRAALGPLFATARYHDYFYGIAPQYARADRPAYQASSGYSGWRGNLSASLQRGRLGLYGYASYDNLRDAVFIDSALVEQTDYWIVGMMISWRLWSSEQRPETDLSD